MSDGRRTVIEIRDAVKTYEDGRVRALDGATLTINQGEFVAVIGPSGCGKSTLLHMIGALDMADSGAVMVNGEDIATERNLNKHRARETGLVFQLDNLLPTLSAAENVQVPMFETRLKARERRTRAAALLQMVGLEDRIGNRPAEMSGGERQRVAIARALANDPGILLMDEPTGRLDQATGKRVLDLVEQLNRDRGLTVVLVTHDPAVAARAGRIIRMVDGRVVDEGRDKGAPAPATADAAAG
jgi:putative ABC transport system ATP-binding protein